MKTRILSGAAIVLLTAAFLVTREFWSPVTQIVLAVLCMLACYEMLWRTGKVRRLPVLAAALVFCDLAPFAFSGALLPPSLLCVLFFLALALLLLSYHTEWPIESFAFALLMPLLLGYGFGALARLLDRPDGRGLFYFLLLFGFSSVADTGAYFVGSFCGKHKLSPVISPKKTVEGVVGGIVLSLAYTALLIWIYGSLTGAHASFWLLAATPVLCCVGVCGDLFASCIKRSVGVKDYGNLIPGHGGILDRMDSILFLAPVLDLLLSFVEVFA